MKPRIIAGVIGGLAFILLIINGGILFELAIGLLISIGTWEYHKLAGASGFRTSFPLILGLSLIYFTAHVLTIRYNRTFVVVENTGLFLLLALFGSFFLSARSRSKKQAPEELLPSVAANLFGLVYPGILLSYIILIRGISSPPGWQILLFLFFTIWGNDTGAYFSGLLLGRTPLAPKISPHKTVEGAIGGLLIGTIIGILFGETFDLPWSIISLSLIIGIVGQVGDLFESLLKRGAKIKDSGQIIPGHGGVLDRFDSVILNLPLVYFLVVLLL